MKKPSARYGGPEGIKTLAKLFDYFIDPFSQDWTYEVSEPERISDYIAAYKNHPLDDDAKFSLMEMIIQAVNDQPNLEERERWWKEVGSILRSDFDLHEYTIYYWSCFDSSLENSFEIAENMRELWANLKA
jgi:hypothetical protein